MGTRFWPISRTEKPKQFLDILGFGHSFLQETFNRFCSIIPKENFIIVTNELYRDIVLKQLPELDPQQVLCEPIGRNTAPCIAYTAFKIGALDPNATLIITPSDHVVLDTTKFCNTVEQCAVFAENNEAIMTIGIKPSRPETGYGYIQVGSRENVNNNSINLVKTFTEKPNAEMAQVFLDSGEFLWNSGIFITKPQVILEAIKEHIPDTYMLFNSIAKEYNTPNEQQAINMVYSESKSISIDVGVMEKTDNAYVCTGDFGWSDIGTWSSIYQYSTRDGNNNAADSNAMLYNTKNCVIRVPKGKISVIEGLSNFVVVDTDDILMICPMEHEQNIKVFIDDLKYKESNEHF